MATTLTSATMAIEIIVLENGVNISEISAF